MPLRNRIPTACLTLLLIAPSQLKADGLISQVPKDGAWAEFDMKLSLTDNGQSRERTAFLRISSVGKEEHDGMPSRWIELKITSSDQSFETEVTKLLIPEKALAAGKDIPGGIIRGWQRREGQEAFQFDKQRAAVRIGPLALLLPGPLTGSKKASEELKIPVLGTVLCDKETGTQQLALSPQETLPAEITIWRNAKATFGGVKVRAHVIDKSAGRDREGVFEVIQVKSGADAKTELPDQR